MPKPQPTPSDEIWVSWHHREFRLPLACIEDCSASGSNDESVAYWQPRIALNQWTRSEIIQGLLEYGAWTSSELNALSDNDLEEKILWLACHDAKEQPND